MADSAVYTDIESVPLDNIDVPEGDALSDGVLSSGFNPGLALARVPFNDGTTSPPWVIPFNRPLRLGDAGQDVVGAKRAIWRANGYQVSLKFTKTFGSYAVRELKKFQRGHHLAADGVLGVETLKRLAPHFDSYAYLLYVGYPPNSTTAHRVVAYSMWGYNNRGAIGYAQYRPMTYLADLYHLPINEDCSTFATKAYKYGAAPDPNGLHYSGYGNTGTMRQHGTLVSLASSRPGDLAHYDNPQHVGVIVVGGSNGRVVEHGSSVGPLLLATTYRTVVQVRRYF